MNATKLADGLYLLDGAVNTGVLLDEGRALLFDCCDTVTPERLADLGVRRVERICATQHRRVNILGAYRYVAAGARLAAPAGERHLLEDPAAYWGNDANRWHIYHARPGQLVPHARLAVDRGVGEGDTLRWGAHTVRVLDTPGATDAGVSYVVEIGGKRMCFCGDAIYGPGRVWDIHGLQKAGEHVGGYHGFMGHLPALRDSLAKLAGAADVLIPSHGQVIVDPAAAVRLTLDRLDAVWRNYAAISSVSFYFPEAFADLKDDPAKMAPAATREPPEFIRRAGSTTFVLVSDDGAAMVMDCGQMQVIEQINQWLQDGSISSVEACWLTHYHDDHVDALPALVEQFGCPIVTDEHLAEIVEHPDRFFLPCISPVAATVARRTRDGESWRWHEFNLTAFHFPGQTLYHSGLLAEGHGKKVFFAGDSGSPNGVDDHCCGNRNFLGEGLGFRRCIEIWRSTRPDYILNEHQGLAFRFTDEQLDYMDGMLAERERMLAELLPWKNPNFGTDEWWVRCYPYEQDVDRGGSCDIEVRFTNHGPAEAVASARPVLPEGWSCDTDESDGRIAVAPRADGAARFRLTVAAAAAAEKTIIPFRVTWDGRYLGAYRCAIVNVL